MRSALTALLYHTGETSSKLMLVLTTNRPMDIDVAVLDRIDESVEFPTPSKPYAVANIVSLHLT